MGCGAVCETQAPRSCKHHQYSQQQILNLIPALAPHYPLLPEHHLSLFTSSLRQNIKVHVLPVGKKVTTDEELPQPVLDKWRAMLFGLEKGDYVFRRCVGFGDEK